MPQNKLQHFVPKFYFRNFSKDKSSIEIFNLKSSKLFSGGIKGQCAKNYFYGKDLLVENNYSDIEAQTKPIFDKIINYKSIKVLSVPEMISLNTFLMLQYIRTEKNKNEYDEMVRYTSDKYLRYKIATSDKVKESGLTPNMMDKYKVVDLSSAKRLAAHATSHVILLDDLQPILMVNETDRDFIFSDTPVVLHNSYFNDKTIQTGRGFQSNGLQIFYPISSKLLYILTDPNVYIFDTQPNGKIFISNRNDILAINNLQYLYCNENVYFENKTQSGYVSSIHKKLKNKRKNSSIRVTRKVFREQNIIRDQENISKPKINFDFRMSILRYKHRYVEFEGYRNATLILRAKHIEKEMLKQGLFKLLEDGTINKDEYDEHMIKYL